MKSRSEEQSGAVVMVEAGLMAVMMTGQELMVVVTMMEAAEVVFVELEHSYFVLDTRPVTLNTRLANLDTRLANFAANKEPEEVDLHIGELTNIVEQQHIVELVAVHIEHIGLDADM